MDSSTVLLCFSSNGKNYAKPFNSEGDANRYLNSLTKAYQAKGTVGLDKTGDKSYRYTVNGTIIDVKLVKAATGSDTNQQSIQDAEGNFWTVADPLAAANTGSSLFTTAPSFKSNKPYKLWKYIIFGILTLGIYTIYMNYHMVEDVDKHSPTQKPLAKTFLVIIAASIVASLFAGFLGSGRTGTTTTVTTENGSDWNIVVNSAPTVTTTTTQSSSLALTSIVSLIISIVTLIYWYNVAKRFDALNASSHTNELLSSRDYLIYAIIGLIPIVGIIVNLVLWSKLISSVNRVNELPLGV